MTLKYPVRTIIRSSDDHNDLIPSLEVLYHKEDFYVINGSPQELFSYCKYQLDVGLSTDTEDYLSQNGIKEEDYYIKYGYDSTTLALVKNAKIPYLRCHYDIMGHSFPCGRSECPSSDSRYSQMTVQERDHQYPIVASGAAAIYAWNLVFDNQKQDFVLPCSIHDLAERYYYHGLRLFLESHCCLSSSSMTNDEKEAKFLRETIRTELNCLSQNNLSDYPMLMTYTKEFVDYYIHFLKEKYMEIEKKVKEAIHPKVFVSYSHDNEDHKRWVLKLATDLRTHGVDVTLDQWDIRLGDDLPFYMEQGLSTSSMVLCVCSDEYVKKANAGKGGAGYEKKILAADMMKDIEKNYVIPVMKNTSTKALPYFLAGNLYVDFTEDDYQKPYTDLLCRIYDEDLKAKPALGVNPFLDNSVSGKIDTMVKIQKVEFNNPNFAGTVVFDYKRNSGVFRIGNGDYVFDIHWSECGDDCIYCYRDGVKLIGYNADIETIPTDMPDIDIFDFTSRLWQVYIGQIVILVNNKGKIAALKVTDIKRPKRGKGASVTFEYVIYSNVEQ